MDPRTDFLLQLLQKLGAPLMSAVCAHGAGQAEAESAQTMASLLTSSVKVGIGLSQAMNLKPADGDADAIRVALTTLAAGLVAESYRITGRSPGDADLARIQKSLESVMVFADNFAPAPEHAQRLKTLDNIPPFFDPVQANIYSIHAFLPAIAAISEFSFGLEPASLIRDVAERLNQKAQMMAGGDSGLAGMITLSALGQVYASAHRAETDRLAKAGDSTQASIESVWAAFDKQSAMLDVLVNSLSGSGQAASSSGGGGVRPAMETPVAEAPAAPLAAAPPPAVPPAPPAEGGNPMSFFKKK